MDEFGRNQENWVQVKDAILYRLAETRNPSNPLHIYGSQIEENAPFIHVMVTDGESMYNDMSLIVSKLLGIDIQIIQPKEKGFVVSNGSYQPYMTQNHVNSFLSFDSIYIYFDGLQHYDAAISI